MVAILIHPADMMDLLEQSMPSTTCIEYRDRPKYNDDLIEINGKLYLQTTRVPAQTKNPLLKDLV